MNTFLERYNIFLNTDNNYLYIYDNLNEFNFQFTLLEITLT